MKALEKLTHDLIMMENNTKGLLNSTRTGTKWHERITGRHEVLITHIVRMYLEKINSNDIYEPCRKYNKIESFQNIFDRGVEWEGCGQQIFIHKKFTRDRSDQINIFHREMK
jgi:hypothetical protein